MKGVDAWEIDKSMLIRGLIIALLDLTVVSLGSGHWNLGVLFAIGMSMNPHGPAPPTADLGTPGPRRWMDDARRAGY